MAGKTNQPSYADAMAELEKIIRDIEAEDIDLDHLTGQVKRAKFLINYCKGKLRETEGEVKKILSEITEEPAPEDTEKGGEGLFGN